MFCYHSLGRNVLEPNYGKEAASFGIWFVYHQQEFTYICKYKYENLLTKGKDKTIIYEGDEFRKCDASKTGRR